MKRTTILTASVLLAASLAACSDANDATKRNDEQTEVEQTKAEETKERTKPTTTKAPEAETVQLEEPKRPVLVAPNGDGVNAATLDPKALWTGTFSVQDGDISLWIVDNGELQLYASDGDIAYVQQSWTGEPSDVTTYPPRIDTLLDRAHVILSSETDVRMLSWEEGAFEWLDVLLSTTNGRAKVIDGRWVQTATGEDTVFPDGKQMTNVVVTTFDRETMTTNERQMLGAIGVVREWSTNDDFPLPLAAYTWRDEWNESLFTRHEYPDFVPNRYAIGTPFETIESFYNSFTASNDALPGARILITPTGFNYIGQGDVTGFSLSSATFLSSASDVTASIEQFANESFQRVENDMMLPDHDYLMIGETNVLLFVVDEHNWLLVTY